MPDNVFDFYLDAGNSRLFSLKHPGMADAGIEVDIGSFI